MAHIIDPTVTGNYPVILGDGLLGNPSNEIFTGIRYNHKPDLTSDAKLKPSVAGKTSSYDLSFNDPKGAHAFIGTRTTENDDYVLYFDPQRKAFVLDKVDSTFDMNVTRLPGVSSQDDLRRLYPPLDKPAPLKSEAKKTATTTTTTATTSSTANTASGKTKQPASKTAASSAATKKEKLASAPRARKNDKKQQPKKFDLALPMPMPQQPKPDATLKSRKKHTNDNDSDNHDDEDDDEEEEEEDDGDLLVEYPGAENIAKSNSFSTAPSLARPRRFDDFMDQRESEADDADGESDDEPRMIPRLPSPAIHQHNGYHGNGNGNGPHRGASYNGNGNGQGHGHGHGQASDDMEIDEAELEAAFENEAHGDRDGDRDADAEGDGEADDMEDELAKEMEEAFEHLHANGGGKQQYGSPNGDESEISEED